MGAEFSSELFDHLSKILFLNGFLNRGMKQNSK